jgi:hypothetical protein
MAVPLYALFELSIVIIRWLEGRRGTSAPAAALAVVIALTASTLAGENAQAASTAPVTGKHSSWSFGLGLALHELQTDSIHDVRGKAGRISLGYVAGRGKWEFSSTLDLVLGPYEPVNPGQLRRIDVDYNGTGITVLGSYQLGEFAAGTPALLAGVGYIDATGRAIGSAFEKDLVVTDSQENSTTRTALLDNYVLRSTRLSAIAGASFNANWRKPRKSNSREDLKTTIDGYVISAWIDVPVIASYTANYDELQTTGTSDKATGSELVSRPVTDRGSMRGYSLVVQTTALLGS